MPVQEAAESVLKAYSLFTSGSYEIFSYSSAPFESAQQAAAELAKTIRDALHKAEDRLAELKEEQDQNALSSQISERTLKTIREVYCN